MGAMVHPSIWMVHPKCLLLLFDVYKMSEHLEEISIRASMNYWLELGCFHMSRISQVRFGVIEAGASPISSTCFHMAASLRILPEWPEPMHVFHITIMLRKVLSSVISMRWKGQKGVKQCLQSESDDAESSVVATTKQRRKRSISDCIGSACVSSKKPKKASISSIKNSFVGGTKRQHIEKDEQVAVKATTGENIPRPNRRLTNFVFYDSDERAQPIEMLEICNVYVAVPYCLWKKVLIRGRKRVSDVNILGV